MQPSTIQIMGNSSFPEEEEGPFNIPQNEPELAKCSSAGIVDQKEEKKFNDLQGSNNPQQLEPVTLSSGRRLNQPPPVFRSNRQDQNSHRQPLRRLCEICGQEPPARSPFCKCHHKTFCLSCVENRVKECLNNDPHKLPTCGFQKKMNNSEESCEAQMLTEIGSIFFELSEQTRKRVDSVTQANRLSSLIYKDKHCCAPNCNGWVRKKDKKCNRCLKKHCPSCWELAHEGECGQSVKLPSSIVLWKCKQCGFPFEKNGGCPKVWCPVCRRYICYKDGEEWSFRHHSCADGGLLDFIYNAFTHYCCEEPEDLDPVDEQVTMRVIRTSQQ